MTMDELKVALKGHKIARVARATGLSRQAIYFIMTGKTAAPRLDSFNALVEYVTRKKA